MRITRFQGAAAWALLSQAEQASIGAVALELVVAGKVAHLTEAPDTISPLHRAAIAAGEVLVDMLDMAVAPFIENIDFTEPPIPSLLGRVCRACGCSQQDACGFGCSWVSDDLCSTCTVPARAAS